MAIPSGNMVRDRESASAGMNDKFLADGIEGVGVLIPMNYATCRGVGSSTPACMLFTTYRETVTRAAARS